MSVSASLIKSRSTKFDYKGSIKLYGEDEIASLFDQYSEEYECADRYLSIDSLLEMEKEAKTPEAKRQIKYWLKVARKTNEALDFCIG
jgi:hypothetical protein